MSLEAVFARWQRQDWKAFLRAQDAEREAWIAARPAPYEDEGTKAWMRNQLELWLAGTERPRESNQAASPRSEAGANARFSALPNSRPSR